MPDADHLNYDARIIQQAIEGDKQAFGQLYETYAGQIFKYLFFRMSTHEAAEDMMEIVFLKAWEALPAFGKRTNQTNFRAWLYRIAHNALIDFRRTKKDEVSLEVIENIKSKSEKPEKVAERKEESAILLKAIQMLDEVSQHVLVSRFIGEMNHRETAQMLGLSEGHVRVIQYRALKKLREFLGEENE
ncbi:MAG TPA: sigma-70 family RNA polymerase sigma factor [Pelolinea sp.]|nr:sigma-70 family RNA polymerase sigma factor [Pelolinea sp.]